MVVNTNDPDYEHIYSIEAYDEPAENTPLLMALTNQSDGTLPLSLSPSLSLSPALCLSPSLSLSKVRYLQ